MAKRVLLTGATGLVGRELSLRLLEEGYELVVLGRSPQDHFRQKFELPCEYHTWSNPAESEPPLESLHVDHVIHLMGESLANGRWNEKKKETFVSSRVDSTRNLVTALNRETPRLRTFVSASAIGVYGNRGDEELEESASLADDFLAGLCRRWEEEAQKSKARAVQMRIGLVLSENGGVLAQLAPIFRNGLGGPLSNGRHWMSWIHIEDLVEQILFALSHEGVSGAVNAVAPEPVRNKEFTRELAQALDRVALFPVPALALRVALGEFSEALLASQRVQPSVMQRAGYSFRFRHLHEALSACLGWRERSGDQLFRARQWVPRNRDEVFDFFCNEKNLEKLTPAFLNFKVLQKSTEKIQKGTLIDYQLKLHGFPVNWRTEITDWQPGSSFQDRQLKGPYAKWDHTHSFRDLAGGVLLTDDVVYRLPLTFLGSGALGPWVRSDVQKIFGYRQKVIAEIFGGP